MEQEIIKLVRLSATKSIRDIGFCFPCISIRSGGLIRVKSISESTKYVDQLFISIPAPTGFGL